MLLDAFFDEGLLQTADVSELDPAASDEESPREDLIQENIDAEEDCSGLSAALREGRAPSLGARPARQSELLALREAPPPVLASVADSGLDDERTPFMRFVRSRSRRSCL